jgi:putative colanic acid biosynthesis UDP-glucose lipid carrier transferase
MNNVKIKMRGIAKSLSFIPGGKLNEDLERMSYYINSNVPKRLFDITVSFLVIVLIMTWFYPIIWILIKLSSSGSALFKQKRVGYMGGIFSCYKFRTMKSSASPCNSFTPTSKSDSRVTRIGRLLRKTNLDELPQIFNVLLGDMSIVGPRPHPIAFQENYASFINNIEKRQLVKPGITGLAQVKGFRGDVLDPEENKIRLIKRVKFDVEYIKNWSFRMDIYIISKTVWQMVVRDTKAH